MPYFPHRPNSILVRTIPNPSFFPQLLLLHFLGFRNRSICMMHSTCLFKV
ncbi:hypothetical protein CIPAW_11G068600 [Carya illinoinensis]|uniref:Uncharacterized protein n=1 Tax=Carya illinoinensis TaxID=32201 RepID=A0A8T1P367_CARIL|nr:hypothetical protein CIPAW_11G068600 [Carya illinoinensis]